MDLYSIGELLIDFIPGDGDGVYIRNAGGAPANVAIAAAKNGLSSGLCCCVGDDDFGHFLLDTLEENGVRHFGPAPIQNAVTTMAFVTLTPDGDRSFTFVRKPGADMFIQERDVLESDIRDAVIIHAGSCSLSASPSDAATARALRLGRKNGKLVSFDLNYRNVMWDNDSAACMRKVETLLPYVDILKISEDEASLLGGETEIFARMEQYGLTLVIETLGSKGVRAWYQGDHFDIPGRKAVCVDATGAGDAFWGGFLSSLRIQGVERAADLNEQVIRMAMEYGNIAGWLCVQGKGAIASLPTRSQVEQYC